MQVAPPPNPSFSIYYLSEQAVTLEFGKAIDWTLLQQIISFRRLLEQNPFPGFLTAVTAYATLSVFFDPVIVITSSILPGRTCFNKVSNYLNQLQSDEELIPDGLAEPIIIPVCYGGIYGPDLEELAAIHRLSAQEVIGLHCSVIYKVYMIGFVPGFAYMGGLPDALDTPRKQSPRGAVPAGAVGIAGKQTGIYPLETPGGWQIIGQTPLRLFDAGRPQPALLKAGDQVVFKPVSELEFEQYLNDGDAVANN